MQLFHFTHTFRNLDTAISLWNKDKEHCERIKGNHRSTMIEILKLWAAQCNRNLKRNEPYLQALFTTNVTIANKAGFTPRTVRNHINRLCKAGLLAKIEWHGTNSQFEIMPATELIEWNHQGNPYVCHISGPAPSFQRFDSTQRKNFPHKGILKPQNNTLIEAVENVDNGNNYACRNEMTDDEKVNAMEVEAFSSAANELETETGNMGMQQASCQSSNGGADAPGRRFGLDKTAFAQILTFVAQLWAFIECNIYGIIPQHVNFMTNSQRIAAKAHLIRYFLQVPKDQRPELYRELETRLQIVQEWLERSPDRYVPIPGKWLDPGNAKGFANTKRWLDKMKKDSEQLERYKARYELEQKKYKAFRDATNAFLTRPSSYEVYRSASQRISKIDPALLEQFNQMVLDNHVNQV